MHWGWLRVGAASRGTSNRPADAPARAASAGATGAAGSGSSKSVALTMNVSDGLSIGAGMGDAGTSNESVDSEQKTIFATYAMGAVSAGAQYSAEDTTATGNWRTTQWGLTFNINDNKVVEYNCNQKYENPPKKINELIQDLPNDGINVDFLFEE